MSHAWKKNDTDSPEYKRKFAFWITACIFTGAVGGLLLAHKISEAEAAYANPDRVHKAKNRVPNLPPPPKNMNKPK